MFTTQVLSPPSKEGPKDGSSSTPDGCHQGHTDRIEQIADGFKRLFLEFLSGHLESSSHPNAMVSVANGLVSLSEEILAFLHLPRHIDKHVSRFCDRQLRFSHDITPS